jgi:hypothetical protein
MDVSGTIRPLFRPKVVGPSINPRVENGREHSRNRIDGSDVGTFESIAVKTGQSKIVKHGLASMLLRNNVIRFVRKERFYFSY